MVLQLLTINKMKVSIIIPSYNAAKYLSRSIESCLKQTYKNIEIIVVNDGSTDDTINVVSTYMKSNNYIRLVNQSNKGLVSARKKGIENAEGEYVFFLDADDYIENDAIMLLVSEIEQGDIIIGDIKLENENNIPVSIQHANNLKYGISRNDMYLNYLSKQVIPSLCGRLIRKSLIENIDTPKDTTIGEDVITNFLILHKHPNLRTKLVKVPIYHYIQYPNSMINTKSKETLLKRIEYIKWIISFWGKNIIEETKVNQNEILSYFVLTEYYSFLRDGGLPSYDVTFHKKVICEFWNRNSFKEMSFWQRFMLKSYKTSNFLGQLYRYIFVLLRAKLK